MPESAVSTAAAPLREPVTPIVISGPRPVLIIDEALDAVDGLRRRLPHSNVPVYLAAGALAVTGVIELPMAVGVSALYLTFKWWPLRARHESSVGVRAPR